ncbi:MAG: Spy/CpxP family protein refolding chaperone [Campylobacterales bacterium]|nr:Spy/CpxP family protein refolding chaperone [Campylobacterales bacterium]
MKNKLTLSIAALMAVGTFAFAQPSQGDYKMQQKCGMHTHSKMNNADIFGKLNLSDSQKRAMAQNRQANFKNMKFAKQNKARVKMSNYLNVNGFDKNRFIRDRAQMSQNRAAYTANSFSKQYDVLTPSQKKQFIKLLKEKEANKVAKMGRHGPRGGSCSFKQG